MRLDANDSSTATARHLLTGTEPYTGPWGETQVRHLLRRTMFGARKEDVTTLSSLSIDEAIEHLLSESDAPAVPVNDYNRDDLTDPQIAFGDPWVHDYGRENADLVSARVVSLKAWWIHQMISDQTVTAHEKLIYFWHNHLATQSWEIFWPHLTYLALSDVA